MCCPLRRLRFDAVPNEKEKCVSSLCMCVCVCSVDDATEKELKPKESKTKKKATRTPTNVVVLCNIDISPQQAHKHSDT